MLNSSQPEYDTSIINPHSMFNPTSDVTKFFSYFTTIQFAPFLTLSLTSIHQLLFQIPRRFFPALLPTFPTNGKTSHCYTDSICIKHLMFLLVLYFINCSSGNSILISGFCAFGPDYIFPTCSSVYLVQCLINVTLCGNKFICFPAPASFNIGSEKLILKLLKVLFSCS